MDSTFDGPGGRIELRELSPLEVPGFVGLTFPSYRGTWLTRADAHVALGAMDAGAPIGLALCGLHGAGHATLLSLVVAPSHRGRGVATALLRALDVCLRRRGVERVEGSYVADKPSTPALERVLAKGGWAPPLPRMHIFQAELAAMQQARWTQTALSADFEIVPWAEVGPHERDALDAWHAADAWIPDDLTPARHEADHEPLTSLGLRRNGRLVGWVITHRLDAETLRFSAGWVHPDLQMRGRLLALYAESGRRAEALGVTKLTWSVPLHHEAKSAFAARWMEPYAHRRETRGSVKLLDGGH
ncbi:MAG: GNAT family N-acetyltransferase [Candidatus Sericytochromatia bacterium]